MRVRSVLRAGNAQRIDHPNFAIRTGVVVPAFYQFYSLPSVLSELYPEYSGYDYVLVGNEILVIEPATRRIVDIIEA